MRYIPTPVVEEESLVAPIKHNLRRLETLGQHTSDVDRSWLQGE